MMRLAEVAGHNRRQRNLKCRQLVLPSQGWQALQRPCLHPHRDLFLGLTAVHAFVGRDVAEIPADGHLDKMFVHHHIIRRIDPQPAQVRQPSLTPSVALRFLVRPVQVAAHIPSWDAEGAQDRNHQVRKILTHTLALFKHNIDG